MLEQSSYDLLMVTAQLIEAACRAREGDSDGTRAHIARAVTLLDRHPGPEVRQTSDRGPRRIPRGGFAAWRSRRLAAHVDANLSGKIVIKDLAASLDMSVGHFCRAFKRTFGMPAGIWIRHRRIELAQGLMLTTGASLSEIALSCGMSDQSHFTRSFRRVVGETPSSWRQARHGAIEERVTSVAIIIRRACSRYAEFTAAEMVSRVLLLCNLISRRRVHFLLARMTGNRLSLHVGSAIIRIRRYAPSAPQSQYR